MAILERMTQADLKEFGYKYTGLMFGFVPVWLTEPDAGVPYVVTRNWWPEWLIDVGHFFFWVACSMSPLGDYQEAPIKITGEIEYE